MSPPGCAYGLVAPGKTCDFFSKATPPPPPPEQSAPSAGTARIGHHMAHGGEGLLHLSSAKTLPQAPFRDARKLFKTAGAWLSQITDAKRSCQSAPLSYGHF